MDGNLFYYERYMDEYDFLSMKNDLIKKELEKRKEKAFDKLSLFINPALIDNFAEILTSSYSEGEEAAERIISICNLSKEDVLALSDNDEGIYEYLCDKKELYNPYNGVSYEYMYG